MDDPPADTEPAYEPALFALSAAVYAQREGKILVLKRAGGEATGGWYLPGGAVDPGETAEQAAIRELREESGLAPSGPLTFVGVSHMHVYGRDSLQVTYACECLEGDVVLSHEHSGARWVDPVEYRERYFNDRLLEQVAAADAHLAGLIRSVRENLDRYIEWRAHQLLDRQLRVMRLTAEVFVVRDGRILLLKRRGGIGDGVWYLPGGIVEPREDPVDTAVRETYEESGLRIDRPRLMRVWGYPAQNGIDAFHATYFAPSAQGEVVVSEEHSDFRWMTPREYVERYCNEQVQTAAPEWAGWLREVRANCLAVEEAIAAAAAGPS